MNIILLDYTLSLFDKGLSYLDISQWRQHWKQEKEKYSKAEMAIGENRLLSQPQHNLNLTQLSWVWHDYCYSYQHTPPHTTRELYFLWCCLNNNINIKDKNNNNNNSINNDTNKKKKNNNNNKTKPPQNNWFVNS